MFSPERQKVRRQQQEYSQDPYIRGLNRLSPSPLDLRLSVSDYQKGFVDGVRSDFDYKIDRLEVPITDPLHTAFLSGLACTDFPGLSKEVTAPLLESYFHRSYDLGLKLLFLHLGYPEEGLEKRIVHFRTSPWSLDAYRYEVDKLQRELGISNPL